MKLPRRPGLELEPALTWVLIRAYAGEVPAPRAPADAVLEIATTLGLDVRIGARIPPAVLERELGATAAADLRASFLACAAREGLLERTTSLLKETASAHGIPVVLLKHAALRRLGAIHPGERFAADVDVLAPRALARSLQEALLAAGCSLTSQRGYEHQLPALAALGAIAIEVHLHVPGLRLSPRGKFATAEELLQGGLLIGSDLCFAPVPHVAAAHAIAHGFLQNAATPQTHSLCRTLADLTDLQALDPTSVIRAAPLLSPLLGVSDLAALAELVTTLRAGRVEQLPADLRGVMNHVLSSRLDAAYAQSLRARVAFHPLSERPFPWPQLAILGQAFLPTDAELDAIYGPTQAQSTRWLRRAYRPFDLAGRMLRAVPRWYAPGGPPRGREQ